MQFVMRSNSLELSSPQNQIEPESSKELPKHFDALVVLGRNWREYPGGKSPEEFKLHLSVESKMSAVAAGEMFRQGLVETVIFSGGKTAGQKFPSEAAAMAEYLKKKYPEIPERAIVLEEESIDTPENAEQVARMVQNNLELKTIALLTGNIHLPRAQALFKEFGVETHPFPAEDELKGISKEYEQFIEAYSKLSLEGVTAQVREWVLRSLLWVDPKGKIPRVVTNVLRNKV